MNYLSGGRGTPCLIPKPSSVGLQLKPRSNSWLHAPSEIRRLKQMTGESKAVVWVSLGVIPGDRRAVSGAEWAA